MTKMFPSFFLCVAILLFQSISLSSSSNILFFMPFGSISHIYSMAPLANSLIEKGHSVTLLSMHVPRSVLHKNMTIYPLNEVLNVIVKDRPNYFANRNFNLTFMREVNQIIVKDACNALLSAPNFIKVVKDKSIKYDVVIMDTLFSECGLSLIALLDHPPLMYYCTTTVYVFTAWALNLPVPFAVVPSQLLALTDNMNFLDRMKSVLAQTFWVAFRQLYILPTTQGIVDSHYPKLPRLVDIEQNVSIVLANSNSGVLDYSRPLAPFVIEVGATHCKPSKPLPKDLKEFVEGAGEHGFIFFSLGSNVAGTDLDQPRRDAFLKTFARLKQRVLWKFEENMTNLPSNVLIRQWAPQQDLLGHPNIKVFITHGGQLSIQEAVYHGVPMLGLPVMGDQLSNIKNVVNKGIAVEIDYDELYEGVIYEKVTKLMNDPSYKKNSKKYSILMKDEPINVLEKAIFYVEYVIRHQGSLHLRLSAAGNLNLFQYFLVDILAFLILILIVIFMIFKLLFRLSKRIFCNSTSKQKPKRE